MDEEFLAKITNKLKEELARTVQQTLSNTMEDEVAQGVAKVLEKRGLTEDDNVNQDLQKRLELIDQEIKTLKSETNRFEFNADENAINTLDAASDELYKVIKNGENATLKIMDIVESQMDKLSSKQEEIENCKDDVPEMADKINSFFEDLNNDLLKIMTALSFQDITGQQLKKFIDFINNIEGILADIYHSSEEEQENQEKENTSSTENKKTDTSSQNDVDSIISQYGLE